jgi:NAD(P)-dependent dehydrogenase (short-subunit alcohol dehydrogenase family)
MNKTPWAVTDIPPQTGKLAVVTGANGGIGWHKVLELARAGSEVILAARSEASAMIFGDECGWGSSKDEAQKIL